MGDVTLDWSWFWVVLVLGAILLIVLCLWCCRNSRFPGAGSLLSYGTLPRTLLCQVECFGEGNIHQDIMKNLNIIQGPVAPLVLFVYKVSRETEDLHSALQWIEGDLGRNKNDIRAVILLEKSVNKQQKLLEVAHERMFNPNTVVVKILWQENWNSPNKILDCPNNKEAMKKVKQCILQCK